MKVKLLKRLRRKGRAKIFITSVRKTNGVPSGISYNYTDDDYDDLSSLIEKQNVIKAAEHIYMKKYIESKRLTPCKTQ